MTRAVIIVLVAFGAWLAVARAPVIADAIAHVAGRFRGEDCTTYRNSDGSWRGSVCTRPTR